MEVHKILRHNSHPSVALNEGGRQHVVGLSDVGFAATAAVQQQRLSSVKFKIVSRLRNDPVLEASVVAAPSL